MMTDLFVRVSQSLVKFTKAITIEPILVLMYLAGSISHVVESVGIYKVICQQTFIGNPEVDCDNLANSTVNGKSAENIVQKARTIWDIYCGIGYFSLSMIVEIFLGAYSDRHGRKVTMLLGITGMMLSFLIANILFTYPLTTPLYILVISSIISGITGSGTTTSIASYAYLADTVPDEKQLTVRMTTTAVVRDVTSIVGPFIGGASSKLMSRAQTMLLCQILLAAAFAYCLWRIRHIPPAVLRRITIEKLEKRAKSNSAITGEVAYVQAPVSEQVVPARQVDPSVGKITIRSAFQTMLNLLKETFRTFTRPRRGNQRLYLACVFLVSFLNVISEWGVKIMIFNLYVQKAPLSWDQDTMGYFHSAQSVMMVAGKTFGVVVMKKWLNFSDTLMILIASVANIVEISILAFAHKTWIVYASAAVGGFSSLSSPCMQSFLAKHVAADEVGKAYTAFSISGSIGIAISAAVYLPLYYATISFFPGFVFIFASVILVFVSFLVLWWHIDSNFKHSETDVGVGKQLGNSICRKNRCNEQPVSNADELLEDTVL